MAEPIHTIAAAGLTCAAGLRAAMLDRRDAVIAAGWLAVVAADVAIAVYPGWPVQPHAVGLMCASSWALVRAYLGDSSPLTPTAGGLSAAGFGAALNALLMSRPAWVSLGLASVAYALATASALIAGIVEIGRAKARGELYADWVSASIVLATLAANLGGWIVWGLGGTYRGSVWVDIVAMALLFVRLCTRA